MTHIELVDKTGEGILENRVFIVEEGGVMRAEVASIMNPRIKWTFRDYMSVLEEAGFSDIKSVEREEDKVFIVAIK